MTLSIINFHFCNCDNPFLISNFVTTNVMKQIYQSISFHLCNYERDPQDRMMLWGGCFPRVEFRDVYCPPFYDYLRWVCKFSFSLGISDDP